MNALFELAYLSIFQLVVLYPSDMSIRRDLVTILLIFSLGNLVDIIRYINLKYGGIDRLLRYLDDPWNSVNLFTNLSLLVLSSVKLSSFSSEASSVLDARRAPIHILLCTVAPLIWVRTLAAIIPVYPRLGPLLG